MMIFDEFSKSTSLTLLHKNCDYKSTPSLRQPVRSHIGTALITNMFVNQV